MTGNRWLLLLMLCAVIGAAGAARITDKLLAGLYETPDISGTPLRVLPSDTPLEVLEETEDFSRVRLGDGTEGWVESRFITDEKPARIMLLELQAKNSQILQQLRDAERQLKALGGEPAEGSETSDPQLDLLKRQLAEARAEIEVLQGELARAPGATDDAQQEQIASLEQALAEAQGVPPANEQVTQLQQRLAQIAALAGTAESDQPPTTELDGFRLKAWHLAALAMALLLSFIGGVAFKNYRLAKRYGGFRL